MNWKRYNDYLIRRRQILLDFDVIDNWESELNGMNKNKEGRKFVYPDSFIRLLGYMRVYFHLSYRQTEGVVKEHACVTRLPSIPDYSNISRRINRLNITIANNNQIDLHHNFVIAVDSTGIKVSNRGEWIAHKWNVKRGYLKIHLAVDIRKKRILSIHVTSDRIHDGKVLPEWVNDITTKQNKQVDEVIADGAYDSNKNFQFLSFKGITPAIKVRKNARLQKLTTTSETRQYRNRKSTCSNEKTA